VWPASAAGKVADGLARAHVTGPYRTLAQDLSFGIDQLVEIAIRALSTAVNDTFTAIRRPGVRGPVKPPQASRVLSR